MIHEIFPNGWAVTGFWPGIPRPHGSKGPTKCRSVLSSLEFIWLQWRISSAPHEERNTENQQQKRCLCFRGYLTLQTVALGRKETLGWYPSSHWWFLFPRSEPSQCGLQREEETHWANPNSQNSCRKLKAHSAPIKLAISYFLHLWIGIFEIAKSLWPGALTFFCKTTASYMSM